MYTWDFSNASETIIRIRFCGKKKEKEETNRILIVFFTTSPFFCI